VEILDTPGFNAPDVSHAQTARSAFEEADAVVWLLDAAQAMKQSERTVLEEARAARIPVQMLVNKADRLRDDDLEKVMNAVRSSLDDIGIRSWTPPIALSARLALAGKLGDTAALEASRWPMVQELLDAQIVARSGDLKERALRRRAAQIVGQLGARAARRAEEERAAAEGRKARARDRAQAAARLDAQIDDLSAKIAASLARAAGDWAHDLGVIATGRDRSAVARDVGLQRYRVERALARLAPPLASALAALVQGGVTAEADVAPMVRALVRSYAACTEGPPNEAAVVALARSAIASLVERLGAQGLAPQTKPTEAGRMAELASLAEALA
jgi:hypothetical protein